MVIKKRHVRKEALEWFAKHVDLARLDYIRLIRPAKGQAKLIGVGAACAVYFLGFAGGFTGWQNGFVTDEGFAKLVWILMIPSSVIGSFVWMIFDARRCFPVRREMAAYVAHIEAGEGFLWRFAPLLAQADTKRLKGIAVKDAIQLSRNHRGGEIDPQDYAAMVNVAHQLLVEGDGGSLPNEVARELEVNLGMA